MVYWFEQLGLIEGESGTRVEKDNTTYNNR